VTDEHLCCGSVGSYSILQPRLAGRLRDDKLSALQSGVDRQCKYRLLFVFTGKIHRSGIALDRVAGEIIACT